MYCTIGNTTVIGYSFVHRALQDEIEPCFRVDVFFWFFDAAAPPHGSAFPVDFRSSTTTPVRILSNTVVPREPSISDYYFPSELHKRGVLIQLWSEKRSD